MVKILRKSRGSVTKIKCFYWPKSIFRHYCIQNVKDGIQIQVYTINNEIVNHLSQFILMKVKKNLRQSQAKFREKLKKIEAQVK